MRPLKTVAILFLLLLIFCSHNSRNPNKPSNDFAAGDMQVCNCKIIFDSGFYLSVDGKAVDFSIVKSIAIQDNGSFLFLLGDDGDIIKIKKDGSPVLVLTNHGQGPGEWQAAESIRLRNDKLFIHDLANNKIVIYDLNGNYKNTLTFQDILVTTFDVDYQENIIIPNIIYKQNNKTPLFYKYNFNGQLIEKFSNYSNIEEIFSNTPFPFLIRITKTSNILLASRYGGKFYLFGEKGALITTFNLLAGQEWEESLQFKKAFESDKYLRHGKVVRIKNITFDSKGNIYTPWGGNFKGKRTIAMKFSRNGKFLGRVFGNENIFDPPMVVQLATDSTAWMFDVNEFGETRLISCNICYASEKRR